MAFARTAGVMLVLVLGTLAACGQVRPPAEPTGGQWQTMLVTWSDALTLPPPPVPGSAQEREDHEFLERARRERLVEAKQIEYWNIGASVRWNEIARDLVAQHRIEHTPASRVYALLSVAQYDALVTAWRNKYRYRRPGPGPEFQLWPASGDPSYPCTHATVSAASAAVLAYLFPDDAGKLQALAEEHQRTRQMGGAVYRSDAVAGDLLGRRVAEQVIQRARSDRSDAAWDGESPAGAGRWRPAETELPVTPHWSQVKTWMFTSPERFRAPPPPAVGSEEFRRALAAVRAYSDRPTQQQRREAALWADGPGSYAPAGRWNQMAAGLIQEARLSELRAARVLALLNVALMDAGVAVWESKYHYSFIRPWQADEAIKTPVGQPNHPSYPSAHAAFSGAGSEVLAHLFPERADWLRARAEQAAISREYGGMHYRFDSLAGLAQGRAVARLAIARARGDGAP